MAIHSAWRTTEIADHRTAPNNQTNMIARRSGWVTSSTSWLPAPKKIAAVPKLTISANSTRMKPREPLTPLGSGVDSFLENMGASISSASASCNRIDESLVDTLSLPFNARLYSSNLIFFSMSGSWFGARNPTRMSIVATVESLWRYPVKSMRGEELDEMFAGYSGVYGDRLFAFKSSASPKGFPYLTGREQRQMLRYRPRFRQPEKAGRPINLTEAESMPPGVNPVSAEPAELMVEVETPTGETVAI